MKDGPQKVLCPTCGAEPGKPCVRVRFEQWGIGVLANSKVHHLRQRAFTSLKTGLAQLARGEGTPWSEVRKEIGL